MTFKFRADRKLGRILPTAQYDYGRFKAVVGRDGKTRFFPRLKFHYNRGKDKAPPPATVDWTAKAALAISQMYANDQYGDCVIASRYHKIGVWTGNETGTPAVGTDAEVLHTYHSACGAGDNGCQMSVVNEYHQKTGMVLAGVLHKSDGSVALDWTNQNLTMVCLEVFGTADIGMSLPQEWYESADGSDWGLTNSPIVGGHEVQASGYDSQGVWIDTWGGKRRILWAAFCATDHLDECYTSLAKDWYSNQNIAPNGIDAASLAADLKLVASGQVPPLPGPTS
jgi:hypothetical protein